MKARQMATLMGRAAPKQEDELITKGTNLLAGGKSPTAFRPHSLAALPKQKAGVAIAPSCFSNAMS